jgi:putative OmpL-like beta-barrel porin-2
MRYNPWTLALLGAGVASLPALALAEEKVNFVQTALASTTLSGYVDTSAQWNIGTGDTFVPTYAFSNGKADGFNLNVVKLTLEKPVEANEAWGAGYKVDLIAGPDANFLATQSSGVGADFGVKQAYVALHAPVGNGLDFKVGVWDTIIGYEVFESINNPNVTRSYGYSVEPTTHTGIQGTYQFCEAFSATLGIANTFGPVINQRAFPLRAESYKAYLASFTITAPTNTGFLAGSTLTACVINGLNTASPAFGGGAADQTSFYVGATLNTPVTGLKVGACYDYAGVSEQPITGGTSGYANVVGGYVSYQATEKLSFYGRGEYGSSSTTFAFGTKSVIEATATVQYDLWKNVMSRVEFRWDHSADAIPAYGGNPETGPSKDNSYILLADLSYKF